MKKLVLGVSAMAAFALASSAHAAGFVNGGFETGDTTGFTIGGGFRGGVGNSALSPSLFLPGGSLYDPSIASSHSAVIDTGYVDPNVGAALGTAVFSGNYALRVEDTVNGGFASVATQTVANFTDPNIFFTWKAVLLGAHGSDEAATMVITLKDLTIGDTLITRQYNAADDGTGVDPRFSLLNGNYYTADWQVEQLTVDASRQGHDFELSVLGSDCEPTGHWGYVYLDGIGTVNPTVPEPASIGLASTAMLAAVAVTRRRKKQS